MADPHHATDAAEHDADAYQRGTMTIEEQVSTWKLVQNIMSWGSLIVAALVLFLTVWFMPNGSFIGGFLAAAVLFAAGFFMLKPSKKAH